MIITARKTTAAFFHAGTWALMSGVTFCSLLINWYFMIDLVVTHADQGLQGEGRLGGKQLHTSDASQGGGAERRRGRGKEAIPEK